MADPRVLTLDEAFALRGQAPDPDDWSSNQDPDGRVVDAILDRIGCRFSGPHNIDLLTHGERLTLEVNAFVGEALNGGFHQYLWNSSGDSAEGLKEMLKEIGAARTGDLLRRVADCFPNGRIPEQREERWRIIEELETKNPGVELFLDEDRAFYKDEENLYALLAAHILNHREEFVAPPDDIVRELRRQQPIRERLGVRDDPGELIRAEIALKAFEAQAGALQAEFQQEQLALIKELLAAGRKKDAVRAYRSAFDCSLSAAKAAVDELR